MAVPKIDKRMLGELEAMGFPTVHATKALHCSGNSSLEAAINWLVEHANDPNIDQPPPTERRQKLGLKQENLGATVPTVLPTMHKTKPVEPVVRAERLRDCLRTLKKNHKDDHARVTRAFQTLLKILANIVKNPEEEKFRRIRLNNPVFKDRVANLQCGVEFLELCGFQKQGRGYLVMPRAKLDLPLLTAAGVEITSAMENPYFGLLSK